MPRYGEYDATTIAGALELVGAGHSLRATAQWARRREPHRKASPAGAGAGYSSRSVRDWLLRYGPVLEEAFARPPAQHVVLDSIRVSAPRHGSATLVAVARRDPVAGLLLDRVLIGSDLATCARRAALRVTANSPTYEVPLTLTWYRTMRGLVNDGNLLAASATSALDAVTSLLAKRFELESATSVGLRPVSERCQADLTRQLREGSLPRAAQAARRWGLNDVGRTLDLLSSFTLLHVHPAESATRPALEAVSTGLLRMPQILSNPSRAQAWCDLRILVATGRYDCARAARIVAGLPPH